MSRYAIPEPGFHRWELTQEAKGLLDLLPDDEPLVGAEVGTLGAKTASIVLWRRPLVRLYVVDHWLECPDMEDVALHNLSNFDPDRYQVIHDNSVQAAARVRRERLDFVFVDASKAGTYDDAMAWWPTIRSGGFICGHDYGNGGIEDGELVEAGAKRFMDEVGLVIEVYQEPMIWVVRKP